MILLSSYHSVVVTVGKNQRQPEITVSRSQSYQTSFLIHFSELQSTGRLRQDSSYSIWRGALPSRFLHIVSYRTSYLQAPFSLIARFCVCYSIFSGYSITFQVYSTASEQCLLCGVVTRSVPFLLLYLTTDLSTCHDPLGVGPMSSDVSLLGMPLKAVRIREL